MLCLLSRWHGQSTRMQTKVQQAVSLTAPPGRYWPVRTYSHGTVAALASSHSDLPLLLRLLLEQGLKPLKQATEGRYYRLK